MDWTASNFFADIWYILLDQIMTFLADGRKALDRFEIQLTCTQKLFVPTECYTIRLPKIPGVCMHIASGGLNETILNSSELHRNRSTQYGWYDTLCSLQIRFYKKAKLISK